MISLPKLLQFLTLQITFYHKKIAPDKFYTDLGSIFKGENAKR